jgi:hypothetical protein
VPDRPEAFHRPLALPGRLVRIPGAVEISTDVKCCDESGGRFMLVAERAMPWSAVSMVAGSRCRTRKRSSAGSKSSAWFRSRMTVFINNQLCQEHTVLRLAT